MKLNIPANRPPHGPPNQNLTTLALPECALTNASMSSICLEYEIKGKYKIKSEKITNYLL